MDEVNFRANESRGQTCLDYAECSRKWTKSIFVQTRAEGKLVWTMPSAAENGRSQT